MPRSCAPVLCSLLLALAGTATAAEVQVRNGSGTVVLELDLDHLELRAASGAPVVAVVGSSDAADLGRQAKPLAAAGRTPLAIAYPKGAPRSMANRRVITRMVNFQVAPGVDAQQVATAHGLGPVTAESFSPRTYRATALIDELTAAIQAAEILRLAPGVAWAEPIIERILVRRAVPNDPLFAAQWHLKQANAQDINVVNVWDSWRGAGVTIAIIDDALETTHEDLAGNCPALATNLHHNFKTDRAEDNNPAPAADDSHGTMVGGLSAAVGNNGTGVTGVAYEAKLFGLRLIGGSTVTNATPSALAWNAAAVTSDSQVWVSNNSWGPSDDGIVAEPISSTDEAALINGVTNGRGGRGTVYLFAAGNGGDLAPDGAGDSVSYDPYSNTRFVMGIGASMPDGTKSSYSEEGCDLFANAPGGNSPADGMVSVDRTGTAGYAQTADSAGNYTSLTTGGGGTSWATPVFSGVVALLLQSRPTLTWRDAQWLVAMSSSQNDSTHSSWKSLSTGLKHSNRYGFGRANAGNLVSMGSTWTLMPVSAAAITTTGTISNGAIPDDSAFGTSATFSVSADSDYRCESVVVTVSATHPRRGDLTFTLTDPSGNVATIPRRPKDTTADLSIYPFKSVVSMGSLAAGTWTLKAIDQVSGTTGTLTGASLTIHGYKPYPAPTVSGLSVSTLAVGSADTTVTITGSGFSKNAGNEIAMTSVTLGGIGNSLTLVPTITSPTSMTVVIPASRLTANGTLTVTVANPALPAAIGGGGGNATQQTIAVGTGTDAVADFVTRFYVQCLLRQPDAGGLASWTGGLKARTLSGVDVARGFVLSQEFRNQNYNNSDFVDILYRAFFGREPDAGGKAIWMAELARGVLREDVLYGFVRAQEFTNLCTSFAITAIDTVGERRFQVRSFVRRFYVQCLNREPDEGGITGWTDSLLAGTNTGSSVATGFALSQEFINRGTSNSAFLDILYLAFFDRPADAGGKSGWLASLDGGTTRAAVLDGFTRAQEFINLCNLYNIIPFPPAG